MKVLLVLAAFLGLASATDTESNQGKPIKGQDIRKNLLLLFHNPHEPLTLSEHTEIAAKWNLIDNIDKYKNTTAVETVVQLCESKQLLAQGLPFSILDSKHAFQAANLFNVLHSAKTKDTFYKTAVYFRHHINEYMFYYVIHVSICHRLDTQDVILPPLYEIFPNFFIDGETMTTAQRIASRGKRWTEHYPSTYIQDNDVVIRQNAAIWSYYFKQLPSSYFTHDYELNNYYYDGHIKYPFWIPNEVISLTKPTRRGEFLWFLHKQILTSYGMARQSDGLDDFTEINTPLVKEGYTSGLLWNNGVAYPVRPNYYSLQQPQFTDLNMQIAVFELRIRVAIELGFVVTPTGKRVSIRKPDDIDTFMNVIECNVNSPNNKYYRDVVSVWKKLVGNSDVVKGAPIVPSALEQYQSCLRDPAFYMIWKRIMRLFKLWQNKLPSYGLDELSVPGINIKRVEIDPLVTFFEDTYINVTNYLYMDEIQSLSKYKSVLILNTRLNHKPFSYKIHVQNDEDPRTVTVRVFLAPKYESNNEQHIIPDKYLQLELFEFMLRKGQNTIERPPRKNTITSYHRDFPEHLLLPKGSVEGMSFVMMFHISTGSRSLGYPLDRPLGNVQLYGLKNSWYQNVQIYHS